MKIIFNIPVCVEGELITIPGFEDYDFVVHDRRQHEPKPVIHWAVSEYKTGQAIEYGSTREEAISRATIVLNQYAEKLDKVLANHHHLNTGNKNVIA